MDSSETQEDKLVYEPPPGDTRPGVQDYLIFLIGGNPGLISYYEPFLKRLHALLCSSSTTETARFYVYGNSLAGFDNQLLADGQESPDPLGLKDQIENAENLIYDEIILYQKVNRSEDAVPKVILIGHSVGAYILLEMIRQHRERIEYSGGEDFDLIGGILLFPTIVNIAKSPSGLVASTVLRIPHIAQILGAIARFWANLIPDAILYQIIKMIMRFPEHAARTTVRFVKSPMGVRQALHLAKEEMENITEDRWTEEVWGAATAPGTNVRDTANSNLIFYWGQRDLWVANRTRDDLIAARGHRASKGSGAHLHKDWKPTMYVDEDKIPHGFCIKHSETMADWVSKRVTEIIAVHKEESAI
ncbi:MAG: hypothetical protein Q9195_000777 [Heterodermia aff. obscurata]